MLHLGKNSFISLTKNILRTNGCEKIIESKTNAINIDKLKDLFL